MSVSIFRTGVASSPLSSRALRGVRRFRFGIRSSSSFLPLCPLGSSYPLAVLRLFCKPREEEEEEEEERLTSFLSTLPGVSGWAGRGVVRLFSPPRRRPSVARHDPGGVLGTDTLLVRCLSVSRTCVLSQ